MQQSSLGLILASMIALSVCGGCSPLSFFFPEKPVYVPPGVMVELAKDCNLECWITNEKTGERELRQLDAQGGWLVIRPRCDIEPTSEEKRKPVEREETPEPSEPAAEKKTAARW
jgi:hypothetical protein